MVLRLAFRYVGDKTTIITHVGITAIKDCIIITLPLKNAQELKESGYTLDPKDGQLCYCYNITYPDCSELGYCFFEKEKFFNNLDFCYMRVG